MNLKTRTLVRHRNMNLAALAFLLALLATTATAQVPSPWVDTKPLAVDTGTTGLKMTLRRLHTTARLMHTVAHPDDEDGGMLTLESRGHGDSVLQLTLNRGEGGQNMIGSDLFDALGIIRTLELLSADRYYGVEQRFTRVADFGFSKTPDETFEKWGGHDIPLADMVRVIRTFRPDVICTRFQGASRDGHGNHQASGILTREAFHAAADPTRFPEQIREGSAAVAGQEALHGQRPLRRRMDVELETSQNDPLLGESYVQFAFKGLQHQLSQGAGNWHLTSMRRRYSYYKLIDSRAAGNRFWSQQARKGLLRRHRYFVYLAMVAIREKTAGRFRDSKPAAGNRKRSTKPHRCRKDPRSAARPCCMAWTSRALIAKVERLPDWRRKGRPVGELRAKQEQFEHAANSPSERTPTRARHSRWSSDGHGIPTENGTSSPRQSRPESHFCWRQLSQR